MKKAWDLHPLCRVCRKVHTKDGVCSYCIGHAGVRKAVRANPRTGWDQYFMDIAKQVSTRATCKRKLVGAVLVRDRTILSTGYNGSVKGMAHCTDVGCMVEDGHCVPGDTVVSKFQTGHYNAGHRTIEQIWNNWQDPQKRGAMLRMKIRAVTPEGMIVPDSITDVWRAGTKPLLRLTTQLGRSVRATIDHRVLTSEGWLSMEAVRPGSRVALNGQTLVDDVAWLYQKYVTEGRTQLEIAALADCDRKTVKARLDTANIARRDFQFGGWNRGLRRDATPGYKGDGATSGSARSRARRYALAGSCDVCGAGDALQVHHLDGNEHNDADANLLTLCVGCHNVAHTPHAKRERVVFDTVLRIEAAGEAPVFDLTTAKYHNFVADGVVVHNCIRTVHAEANAIIQAAKNGVSINGATIYTTASPCWWCFKLIVNSGVEKIVFGELYRDKRIKKFAFEAGVALHHEKEEARDEGPRQPHTGDARRLRSAR